MNDSENNEVVEDIFRMLDKIQKDLREIREQDGLDSGPRLRVIQGGKKLIE